MLVIMLTALVVLDVVNGSVLANKWLSLTRKKLCAWKTTCSKDEHRNTYICAKPTKWEKHSSRNFSGVFLQVQLLLWSIESPPRRRVIRNLACGGCVGYFESKLFPIIILRGPFEVSQEIHYSERVVLFQALQLHVFLKLTIRGLIKQ